MLSVLFVDADAAAGGDGIAWESAYTDLQSALDSAAAFNADAIADNDVDAIWIAEGTYLPSVELEPGVARSVSFSLVDGVTLYGGFEGTEGALGERDADAAVHQTVLSGDLGVVGDVADNAGTVVYCGEGVTAGLDGVTVTLGAADYGYTGSQSEGFYGGGVFNAGTLTVHNSMITDNEAVYGGGAYNIGVLTIKASTLSNNTATYPSDRGGGAIMNWGGALSVVDSTLSDNSGAKGGAILSMGDASCTNVLFQRNTAFGRYSGGGGFYNAGTATLTQCTFVGNEALSTDEACGGGAIYNAVGDIHVMNSTIAGNRGNRGGGIYNRSSARYDNTVIADNDGITTLITDVYNQGRLFSGAHNLIGFGYTYPMEDGEDGNLIGTQDDPLDPLFVRAPSDGGDGWGDDPATPDVDESANDDYGDLRLIANSPAVNAGSNDLLPLDVYDLDGDSILDEPLPLDLAGNARISSITVDIGAYETQLGAGVLYVDQSSATSGDGSEWSVAFGNLQDALDAAEVVNTDAVAENNVAAVWIAEGTYVPEATLQEDDARSATFSLSDHVTLYGGFVGTETDLSQRDPDPTRHETILSGDLGTADDPADNAYTVVYCGEGVLAILDGLTITGGNADGDSREGIPDAYRGGGAYTAGTLTLSGVRVVENAAEYSGGGIHNAGGTLFLARSSIVRNSARYGGGVSDDSGTLATRESEISWNTAVVGGGIYGLSGTATVERSAVIGNTAKDQGGGLYARDATVAITNSTFAVNSADRCGAIYSQGGLYLTNSTLVENFATSSVGGLYAGSTYPYTTVINNSIIASNLSESGNPDVSLGGRLTGSNNLIGDTSGESAFVNGVDGNLVGDADSPIDPLLGELSTFANGAQGYYLLPGGPALNAGDNALAVDADGLPLHVDAGGTPRIEDGTVDMGAMEGAMPYVDGRVYVVTSIENVIDPLDGELTFVEAFEAAEWNHAVGDAVAGSYSERDVIRFAEGVSGTVILDDGPLTIMSDLKIEGPGADLVAFDAQNRSRVFIVMPPGQFSLAGATVTGGYAEEGGGIWNYRGLLDIQDARICNNTAEASGGGIYNSGDQTVTITNSEILSNSAEEGGGIGSASFSGGVLVVNSTISGNSATNGGGVHERFLGAITVEGSLVFGNSATEDGAGIYSYGGTISISDSTISDNVATGGTYADGGGVYTFIGTIVASDSAILRNESSGTGGGLSVRDDLGSATFRNCVVAENRAIGGGGVHSVGTLTVVDSVVERNMGIATEECPSTAGGGINAYGDTTIVRSAILGNTLIPYGEGETRGGGVYLGKTGALLTLVDTVVAGNSAATCGGGIYNTWLIDVVNSTITGNSAEHVGGLYSTGDYRLAVNNSIVSLNEGGDLGGFAGGTNNLIGIDPAFVRNPSDGGDGWGDDPATEAIDESANDDYGDLRLTGRSPGLDFGDTALLPADVHDLDGDGDIDEPLPVDYAGGPRVLGQSIDVGAYESDATVVPGREVPSSVVTATHDVFDLYDSDITLREAIWYAATSDAGTRVTFAPALDGATLELGGTPLYVRGSVQVDASDLESLTVDAHGESGVFYTGRNEFDDVLLKGFTVTGGRTERGGGVYNVAVLTLVDMVVTDNAAVGYLGDGGGVYDVWTLNAVNCVFTENTTESFGGAIYVGDYLSLFNCTISGNSAGYSGGGICNRYYTDALSIVNSVIAGNEAGYEGGGIYIGRDDDARNISNTILAGNTAAKSGNDLYFPYETHLCDHCLISDGSGQSSATHGTDGNLVGTTEAPIDPLFVRNPSDGGDGWGDDPTTPDIDESANDDFGDLRLLPDSPAINAGNNTFLPTDTFDLDADGDVDEMLPVDLDGGPRIENGIVDMGAYERFVQPVFPADLNGDGFVGSADLDLIRANWGRTVQPWNVLEGDATGDGIVNAADLDLVRANWGGSPPAAATDAVFAATGDGEDSDTEGTVYGPRRETQHAAEESVFGAALRRERLFAAAHEAWMHEWNARRGR